MKIVVDTNIVFSGILNSKSKIAEILISSYPSIQFYSCEYLNFEIHKHVNKLIQITKLSIEEIQELERIITQNIVFINHNLLPTDKSTLSDELLASIDPFDIPFVQLTEFLEAKLWTGDKKLMECLAIQHYDIYIDTPALLNMVENF